MGHEDVAGPPGVLNSWKEIASYLGKDVRTVMRWEKMHGLPVHRLPGGPKAGVYALKSEVDAWRAGQGVVASAGGSEMPAQTAPPREGRRPSRRAVLLASGGLLVAVAVALAWSLVPRRANSPGTPLRVTFEGAASWPTISADGKLFAFASVRQGKSDIYLQQFGGHQAIRVPQNDADNSHPNLSPDGSHIVFRSERDGGGLYVLETVGGTERKIADRGRFPRFSPDGSTIVFLVVDAFNGAARMSLVSAEGGTARPFQPEFVVPNVGTMYTVPMWSPDGTQLLFEGIRTRDGARGLWYAPAAGGPAAPVDGMPPLARGKIRFYTTLAGRYLYFVEGTSVHGAPLMRIGAAPGPWRVSGTPEPLTPPSSIAGTAGIAEDGRAVVMIAGSFVNSVWSIDLRGHAGAVSGELRQETPDAYNQMQMSVASNGSRFAYIGNPEPGRLEIRLADVATRRLTATPLSTENRSPQMRLSPDGSRLAYRDVLGGKMFSYVVPAANPARGDALCESCTVESFFSTSDDVLVSEAGRLVRHPVAGGPTTVIVEGPAREAALSPGDRWVAFVAPAADGAAAIVVAPVRDRPVPRSEWILVAEDKNHIGSPQWSPAGHLLYYVSERDSSPCVWAQTFDEGMRRFGPPVHVFHDPGSPSLRAAPARKIGVTPDRLYLMMASSASSIWSFQTPR